MTNKIFFRIALLFFFLMLVIPTTLQMERGLLLIFLVLGVAVNSITDKWVLDKRIFVIGMINVTASVLFIYWGVINNAPGAISVSTVYVLWPVLFLYFMGALHRPSDFQSFLKTIVLAVMFCSVMGVLLVIEALGWLDMRLEQILEFQGASVGIYDGFIEYQLYNLTTVIFGFGFLISLLMIPSALSTLSKFWRIMILLAFIFSCLALLVSGRRSFWVVAAISPFIVYGLCWAGRVKLLKLKNTLSLVVLVVAFFLVTLSSGVIDIQSMYNDFILGFDFDSSINESGALRKEQFFALYNGWLNSPIVGHGHGSFTSDSVRDSDTAWAYELSYLALLFQIGILGFLIIVFSIVWLFYASVKLIRSESEASTMMIPLLVGLCCLLVANATNPYLAKFDYLWVIFLPIAVLNAYLVGSETRK